MVKKKYNELDEDTMARATRWIPLFIIILMLLLVIVYIQSTRVTVPEAGPSAEDLEPTSKDLTEKIDKSAEDILDSLPSMKMTVTSLKKSEEDKLSLIDMPDAKTAAPEMTSESLQRIISNKKEGKPRAIELITPDDFINAKSTWVSNYVGDKVILLEFWTSSSINSQRQITHLNDWYNAYKDSGLQIIGVHTPEFDFEKDGDVVRSAVKRLGIEYPVVLDNEYFTWRAYDNKFWPSIYLIDIDGFIVYNNAGDADCEEVEKKIVDLLKERKAALENKDNITIPSGQQSTYGLVDFLKIKTPEIYLGFTKNRGDFGNPEGFTANMPAKYQIPDTQIPNSVYLEGEWFNNRENMELLTDTGRLLLRYTSRDVYLVAGGHASIDVMVDDELTKTVDVDGDRLYNIVKGGDYSSRDLELIIKGKGLKIYSVSFG